MALNLTEQEELELLELEKEKSLSTKIGQVSQPNYSLGGFGSNVVRNAPEVAKGLTIGLPVMAGQGLKTIGEQGKAVLTGNYKGLGQSIGDIQKQAIQAEPGASEALSHPIDYAYNNPVEAGLNIMPAVGMAGKALGIAGKVGASASENVASKMINSLIKPQMRQFVYGKNPGRGVAREGIVATSFEDLSSKISLKLKEIGQQMSDVISKSETANKKLDLTNAIKPINEAILKASETPRTNLLAIERLQNAKADIFESMGAGKVKFKNMLDKVSPSDALDLKRRIGAITKFTGSASDDAMVNSALKKSYGTIDKILDEAIPQTKGLNERYADLLGAKVATNHRELIAQRQNIFGISEIMMGLGAGVASGEPTAGLAAALGYKALSSTLGKTSMASGLNNLVAPASRAAGNISRPIGNLLMPSATATVANQQGQNTGNPDIWRLLNQ